jgi:hypothetical protein
MRLKATTIEKDKSMNLLFEQLLLPFILGLESCAVIMAEDVPVSIKLDAFVSRAIYALNHAASNQSARNSRDI